MKLIFDVDKLKTKNGKPHVLTIVITQRHPSLRSAQGTGRYIKEELIKHCDVKKDEIQMVFDRV